MTTTDTSREPRMTVPAPDDTRGLEPSIRTLRAVLEGTPDMAPVARDRATRALAILTGEPNAKPASDTRDEALRALGEWAKAHHAALLAALRSAAKSRNLAAELRDLIVAIPAEDVLAEDDRRLAAMVERQVRAGVAEPGRGEVNGYPVDGPGGTVEVGGHVVPASWAARRGLTPDAPAGFAPAEQRAAEIVEG